MSTDLKIKTAKKLCELYKDVEYLSAHNISEVRAIASEYLELARRLEEAQQKIALAKAEALEKFAYGWGPDDDVWTSKDIRKLSLDEAAKYRAKAGRKE